MMKTLVLPKATFKLDGEIIHIEHCEIYEQPPEYFIGKNAKDFSGASNWFDVVEQTLKKGIHQQNNTIRLKSGLYHSSNRFEFDGKNIVCSLMSIRKLQDSESIESVFYNWLDGLQLSKNVVVYPNFEDHSVTFFFKDSDKECKKLMTHIKQHTAQLKGVIDIIKIYTNGRLRYPLTRSVNKMLAEQEALKCREHIDPYKSLFIKNNPGFLQFEMGNIIQILSNTKIPKFLAAYAGVHPGQFNKPVEVMIGSDYDCIDLELARPLHAAIRAVQEKGAYNYQYTHHWKGETWHMQRHLMILENEIIVKTSYPDQYRQKQTEKFLDLMCSEQGC